MAKNDKLCFLIDGMAYVIGISQYFQFITSLTRSPYDYVGGDFRSVGDDIRRVMLKHSATPETSVRLGEATQMELKGLK